MSNYLDENHDANALLVAIGEAIAAERKGLSDAADRAGAEEELSTEQRAFIAGASSMVFKVAQGVFAVVADRIGEDRAVTFMEEVVWPSLDVSPEAEEEAAA